MSGNSSILLALSSAVTNFQVQWRIAHQRNLKTNIKAQQVTFTQDKKNKIYLLTFRCTQLNSWGPRSRVAGWALAPPIIFPLLVFFCTTETLIGVNSC